MNCARVERRIGRARVVGFIRALEGKNTRISSIAHGHLPPNDRKLEGHKQIK